MDQMNINSSEIAFAERDKPKTIVLSIAQQSNGKRYFHIRKPAILD